MKLSAYSVSVETFVPMLKNLVALLDKAAALAEAKKFDETILVNARLAPDMFTLAMQVRVACNQAQDATAFLTGAEAPKSEHEDKTIAELKSRIDKTIAYVMGAQASAFEGAEDREIVLPIPIDNLELAMKGGEYVRDWALPHFYFHVVTAYDILRHNGVEIGKRDYLSHVARYFRQKS